MALRTLGTNTTTSLSCLVFNGALNAVDFGNLKALLKHAPGIVPLADPNALEQSGILVLRGQRGTLLAQPGDVIAIDPTSGFPILVSSDTITNGVWTLT